jgi:transcriptional regulator with XRE-family HTH domain
MTRLEKATIAQGLRAQGLLQRQIAERMGVAIQTVDSWLNDPDGSRLRARKNSYRGACEQCGAPTDGSNGPGKAPKLCLACSSDAHAERMRTAWAEHKATVERAWAEGKTCREMCELFGWKHKHHIAILRSRGYDLPYRRTPEDLALIRKGMARWREGVTA